MTRCNIKRLRELLPHWEWRANKVGFGYTYLGKLGDREVEVRAHSVLIGEDTYKTEWWVREGAVANSLSLWAFTVHEQ